MDIREKVNQNPGIAIGSACAVIIVAIGIAVLQLRGSSVTEQAAVSGKLFFTTDDGKTWFSDDTKNIPPYAKDGKEAVRAYVYQAGNGTKFVGFLERYSPAGKKALEAVIARPEALAAGDPFLEAAGQLQWKKPGDANWIDADDPRVEAVMKVVSPKGAGDPVTPVSPGQ